MVGATGKYNIRSINAHLFTFLNRMQNICIYLLLYCFNDDVNDNPQII